MQELCAYTCVYTCVYHERFFLFLTAVNTFSCLFSEKYFLSFEVPPFHLAVVIILIISGLFEVELWVELGWNYVKFHPNSTYNSTIYNSLIINMITTSRWKGGTSTDKKYFSEKT